MNLNATTLVGRVGKIETKTFDKGQLTNVSLAINETWKNKEGEKQEKTNWINVVIRGKSSEIAEKYVNKGDILGIEGSIQTRTWDKDGATQYVTEVVANRIHLGPKTQTQGQPVAAGNTDDESSDLPF